MKIAILEITVPGKSSGCTQKCFYETNEKFLSPATFTGGRDLHLHVLIIWNGAKIIFKRNCGAGWKLEFLIGRNEAEAANFAHSAYVNVVKNFFNINILCKFMNSG